MINIKNGLTNLPAGLLKAAQDMLEAKKTNKHGHDAVGHEDEDIDNDGDVDKSDSYLHNRRKAIAKSMKKEEVEESYAAASKRAEASRQRAIKKAAAAYKRHGDMSAAIRDHDLFPKDAAKIKAHLGEESEQIDELSKKTLGSYIMKAASSAADKGMEHGVKKAEADEMDRVMNRHMSFSDKDKVRGIMKTTSKDVEKPREKAGRRIQGINRAVSRITKEDVEQIDEISKKTLASYVGKAAHDLSKKGMQVGQDYERGKSVLDSMPAMMKRETGIKRAAKKLAAESKVDGVANGSMEGDRHLCATKVFHKEWNEGTPIKTMHADPDANGLIEWYDVLFDHGIERVMTEDMEILQVESHMHSKRKMKEETELDEARGRPRKNPLPAGEKAEPESRQHIMQQLQRAKLSMRGGEDVTFHDGKTHRVAGHQAAKILTKYAGMRPAEKETFQKKIGASHDDFKSEV